MSDDSSSNQPPPLHSRADVAKLVGFPIKKLNYWVVGLSAACRYETFLIPRRNGKSPRVIHAPIKPIKDIQLKLAAAFQACYRPPLAVHGYVRARSILSNAKIHSGKRWVLRIDIENFFPSINYGRVRGMFMAYPFNYTPEVATLLAQICCHANELPHGAPTSPTISNLICRGLDKELLSLAWREHCHYSRYCDDLIFDARARFMATQKVRYRPLAKPIPEFSFQWMIRGRVQYVGHIKGWTDPVYLALATTLASVDKGFKEPRIESIEGPVKLRVYVEGPTDVVHLQAALDYFHQSGQYDNLQLTFEAKNGDEQLLNFAKTVSGVSHDVPIVCLFDSDNPKVLKDVIGPQGEVKNWGNGVFSLAIPAPTHREPQGPFCIEMLYTDEELHRTDTKGRRLFLKSEFNQDSGWLVQEGVHCPNIKNKSLVVEHAYRGSQKVSLSKSQFAELIKTRQPPYHDVSFEGFKGLFDTLCQISVSSV
jgi:Reverse transcriptase (RNA-dependent DNA polymerase)